MSDGTGILLLLLRFNLILGTLRIWLCVKCMNDRISLFNLTTLPFEIYQCNYHVFLASSSSENQKAAEFFKRRFLKKKKIDHPPSKMSLFLDMTFLVNTITNLKSNFTWSNQCFLSTE
jgi:hypothetical protein